MKMRGAHFFSLIVVGLLLTTIQIARAQQSSGNDTRNGVTDDRCRTPVIVTGAVPAPIRIELRRRARLNEVLTIAGGFTERARKTVEIKRAGLNLNCGGALDEGYREPGSVEIYQIEELIRGLEEANPYVQPGDKVTATEVGVAYITGNVMNPRPIHLSEPTTLTQAIGMAGGLRPESRTDRVRIFRYNGGETATMMVVDLKAAKKDRSKNIALQAYDIVDIPRKGERHGGWTTFPKSMSPIHESPVRIIY